MPQSPFKPVVAVQRKADLTVETPEEARKRAREALIGIDGDRTDRLPLTCTVTDEDATELRNYLWRMQVRPRDFMLDAIEKEMALRGLRVKGSKRR